MNQLLFDKEIVSRSLKETEMLAEEFYREIAPEAFVALVGPLGAGKTTFVKGIAKAAGCDPDEVTSPSFTLINEYRDGQTPLFHFDLFRLADPSEFYAIGGDEYFDQNGIVLIEWPENGEGYLPENRIEVNINIIDAVSRRFVFKRIVK
ncbi:MAG: tRNA (adenosine(37)-N6)-threonylcarbamoyltransferase complex ATPase subunit type 1 TsaE [candidate division Zixibacteria bacterium]|nr:tRNA (adenosine(37)-N6)-threonylcarbamoyltransferase complex ATPase subunit type 1 TsaE [candidate division Zixibacteria bacterium]